MIEGMGELHLDIIVDRLRREYKVSRCLACTDSGTTGYTPAVPSGGGMSQLHPGS